MDAGLSIRVARSQPGLRPTPAGWAALLFGLILTIAAVNTGNNLLYLLLAFNLGLLAAEWTVGAANLDGLELRCASEPEGGAGEAFEAELLVTRRGRWSSLALLLELPGQPPVALARLPVGEDQLVRCPLRYGRRGLHPLGPVRISSTFPFGLMLRRRTIALEGEAVAFPTPVAPNRSPLSSSASDGGARGLGDELAELGDHREYDDARHIHWPSSARAGRLIARKPRGGSASPEVVVLRTRGRSAGDPRAEAPIARAAGAVRALLLRGTPVRLIGPELDLGPGEGSRFWRAVLRALARLDPTAPDPAPELGGWSIEQDASA
jgi:uncharacterized protein (DUF58 family)